MSIAFRRFCKISNKDLALSCLSVCPFAWNNSAPTERIFMKVDVGVLYENLSRTFNFPSNLARITGTLHEDLTMFLLYLAHLFLE
jgi:hypothetical protein